MRTTRLNLLLGMVLLGLTGVRAPAATETTSAGSGSDLSQNVVLEATRQDLVERRIDELVTGLGYLQRDLQSNGKLGAEVQKRLETILGRLQTLKDGPLASARGCLREAMVVPARMPVLLRQAQRQIEPIRRELGSLLLQAGMAHAAEVFAAELHEIAAKEEALIQRGGVEGPASSSAPTTAQGEGVLAVDQKELGAGLERLLGEVNTLADYGTTEALAAVRVARARKSLESGGTSQLMSASAQAIEAGKTTEARAGQIKALDLLRRTEIQLRPEAKLQALVRARNELDDLLKTQVAWRRGIENLRPEEFAQAAPDLARRELSLLGPLDSSSAALGIEEFTQAARLAGAEAARHLIQNKKAETMGSAVRVEEALSQALVKLNEQIANLQKLDESYRKLQAAMNRLKVLQDLQERQAQIVDDTGISLAAKKSVQYLADPQRALGGQLTKVLGSLPKDATWATALTGPLQTAATAGTQAETKLRTNDGTPAREAQFQALEALTEAVRTADKEVAFLEQLWTLTQLAGDLTEVSSYVADLQGEQQDVRVQVEKSAAAKKSVLDLTGPQEMLTRAAGEVEESAALIAEARTILQLLGDARQGMGKAAASLSQDKPEAALPLQKEAEDKLAKTRSTALEMAARAEYLIRWISSMEKNAAIGMEILQRQIALRKKTEAAKAAAVVDFEPDQTMLKGETEVWATMEVCGPAYQKAADEMDLAAKALKAGKQAEAVKHQKAAEELLKKALDEMFKWLASLEKMQQAPAEPQERPKLMSVLNRLFVLAIGERDLRDHTKLAVNQEFAGLSTKQDDLKLQLEEALTVLGNREYVSEVVKGFMEEAKARMSDAAGVLRKAERAKALDQEIKVETALRKAIAALMVEAFTPPEEEEEKEKSDEKPDPDQMETPPPPPNPKGDMATFLKAAVKGEEVAKSKQQWESLGQRDRGALNENFARELPLEYRDVLKEYYRTLAK